MYNLNMELYFINLLDKELDKYGEIYNNLFIAGLKHLKKRGQYVISVTLVGKETIHEINKNYRNIDRPTDVISFAFLDDKEEKIKKTKDMPTDLGEIYICYEVALENAKNYGNSEQREMSFLFVHGLLHLLGYDHMTKEDEDIMFPLQEEILNLIKKD